MASRRGAGKGKRAASLWPRRDILGALPDDVLHHVLSFLPAQEAVRTSVLARRWRRLWRTATGLRILFAGNKGAASMSELGEFVDHLLLLRGGSPLDTCQFSLHDVNDDDVSRINLWIQHVLMCKVQVLNLRISKNGRCYTSQFDVDRLPLVSQYLKRLELSRLQLNDSFLDFSSCRALEVLEIEQCDFFEVCRILSESLKRLSIKNDCGYREDERVRVYAPNLVSLWLEHSNGRVPFLERMPKLVDAVVKICTDESEDWCPNGSVSGDCEDEDCQCYRADGDSNNCVLLHGLSEAQSLVLISDNETFILRRDLKSCPIFSNLKTLLLNEYWCVPADFSSLACILEHAPVLEELTLQLFSEGPTSKVVMKASPDPTKRSSSISHHLKIVQIKCEVLDGSVLNVLKFLSKLGIYSYMFQFDE